MNVFKKPSGRARRWSQKLLSVTLCILLMPRPAQAAMMLTPAQWQANRWYTIQQGPVGLDPLTESGAFILETCLSNPVEAQFALNVLSQCQDLNPNSPTYGNFGPVGTNGLPSILTSSFDSAYVVDEIGTAAKLTNNGQNFTTSNQALLMSLIRQAIPSIATVRNRTPISYTNVFLHCVTAEIIGGEVISNSALANKGYADLNAWLAYTNQYGIPEVSDNYEGADAQSLAVIYNYSSNSAAQAAALQGLQFLWNDNVAAQWFPADSWASGPEARQYFYAAPISEGAWNEMTELLAEAGLVDFPLAPQVVYDQTHHWAPPASAFTQLSVPRFVSVKAGTEPWQYFDDYVASNFAIGVAGQCYGTQSRDVEISLPGGRDHATIGLFGMDGRGDPYGTNSDINIGPILESQHCVPFFTSAQNGTPDVLFVSQFTPGPQNENVTTYPLTVLQSSLLIPADAIVWNGSNQIPLPSGQQTVRLDPTAPIFIVCQGITTAFWPVVYSQCDGKPASIIYANDGPAYQEYGGWPVPAQSRITCVHSSGAPSASAVFAGYLHVYDHAISGPSDPIIQQFTLARPAVQFTGNNGAITIQAGSLAGNLRLAADLANQARTTYGPAPASVFSEIDNPQQPSIPPLPDPPPSSPTTPSRLPNLRSSSPAQPPSGPTIALPVNSHQLQLLTPKTLPLLKHNIPLPVKSSRLPLPKPRTLPLLKHNLPLLVKSHQLPPSRGIPVKTFHVGPNWFIRYRMPDGKIFDAKLSGPVFS